MVPAMVTELLSLILKQSKYRSTEFKASEVNHIVVSGCVTFKALKDFSFELFHEDHSNG
jgi:hypothetical protein